jgi:branched-chain amino acid transport system ATP-binding protein
MLEVIGLDAGYGRVQVLAGVDLAVGDGELVALVGSNGAGKTTLLRAISGMIVPTAGIVRWNGHDIKGLAPEEIVDRRIAHVPEGRRLFAGLSVRENLLVGAHRRPTAALDRPLELFPRLGERLDQIAGSLSGGEQQMCAIGRALMSEPELVMIDELSLGLAPKVVDTILDLLAAIVRDETAVLLVEQDVDAALSAAAHGYLLETGRIVGAGQSADLLADPRVREAYLGVT